MRRFVGQQFHDARSRGDAVAVLFAATAAIYPRFGYGLASRHAKIQIEPSEAGYLSGAPSDGEWSSPTAGEAARTLPTIYDRVATNTPGMFMRSPEWWSAHTLADPEHERGGGGPLRCALLSIGSRPEAYALYRFRSSSPHDRPRRALEVIEAVSASPAATRLLWQFVFTTEAVDSIEADMLPVDHPLFLLLLEPSAMRFTVSDGLWLRIVDIEAALGGRSYAGTGEITFEVVDPMLEHNTGRWRLLADASESSVTKTVGSPDLTLEIADLGAVYLGGWTFAELERAGRLQASASDVVERADALFRVDRAPWCPEVF